MHFDESGISKPGGAAPSRANIEQDPSNEQFLARHFVKVKDIAGSGRERMKDSRKKKKL
jgi:hypothetical protein